MLKIGHIIESKSACGLPLFRKIEGFKTIGTGYYAMVRSVADLQGNKLEPIVNTKTGEPIKLGCSVFAYPLGLIV